MGEESPGFVLIIIFIPMSQTYRESFVSSQRIFENSLVLNIDGIRKSREEGEIST